MAFASKSLRSRAEETEIEQIEGARARGMRSLSCSLVRATEEDAPARRADEVQQRQPENSTVLSGVVLYESLPPPPLISPLAFTSRKSFDCQTPPLRLAGEEDRRILVRSKNRSR